MALKRLRYEARKFAQETESASIRAGPLDESNLFEWWAIITGPAGTPYEGGVFRVRIEYPTEYPFKPPKLRFETKIFHANISRKGTVCVDILQKEWSPILTTANILLSVMSLLASPNPDDPMDAESAHLYIENYRRYEDMAKKWTKTYASQEVGDIASPAVSTILSSSSSNQKPIRSDVDGTNNYGVSSQ